jgi:hypothetical protein
MGSHAIDELKSVGMYVTELCARAAWKLWSNYAWVGWPNQPLPVYTAACVVLSSYISPVRMNRT